MLLSGKYEEVGEILDGVRADKWSLSILMRFLKVARAHTHHLPQWWHLFERVLYQARLRQSGDRLCEMFNGF